MQLVERLGLHQIGIGARGKEAAEGGELVIHVDEPVYAQDRRVPLVQKARPRATLAGALAADDFRIGRQNGPAVFAKELEVPWLGDP